MQTLTQLKYWYVSLPRVPRLVLTSVVGLHVLAAVVAFFRSDDEDV
ncbi:MAG: hypothetical protein ACR2PL_05905 [Dehalococcoidia bacterium]